MELPIFFRGAYMRVLHLGEIPTLDPGETALIDVLDKASIEDPPGYLAHMAPGGLRSLILSVVWPAYWLGLHPAGRIVVLSRDFALSDRSGDLTIRLMTSMFYRATFPGTIVQETTSTKLLTTKGGARLAYSLETSGACGGADWTVFDVHGSA